MKMTIHTSILLAATMFGFSAFAEEPKAPSDAKPSADKALAAASAANTTAATPNTTSTASTAKDPKDYVVIKIDGDDIRNSEVQEIWKGLFQGSTPPDFSSFDETIRQNVLRGLISERLIYKEATKAGFDKNEEVKKRIESLQKQLIMQAFMESKSKAMVTDEQIKAAYDEKAAANKGQEEVKARHILVATEAEAKKITEELKKGGDFEKIAKEKSTDKASGTNGGDLGWFTKDKMVPEFADAAFKLKKGEVSAPIKTAFGWHIVKLEDRRPLQMASLEESKEMLKAELTNKAVQTYVEGLLKASSIKYFDETGKEKEFSRTLAAPKDGEKTENSKPVETKPADTKPADTAAKPVKTEN